MTCASALRRTAAVGLVAAAAAGTVQCAPPNPPEEVPAQTTSQVSTPRVTSTAPSRTTTTTTTTTTTQAAPDGARIETVDAAALGATWRQGCPVAPGELRRINLPYLDFGGQTQRGDVVVHQDVVGDIVAIFDDLFRMGYPIAKMRTVDAYQGADDELSMRDNNTSAFNCRPLPSGRWSLHAYGRAVDLNPLLNPYVDRRGGFQPANAGSYLDRARDDPGMLHDGDPAVLAFLDRGWRWGGNWRTPVDYQHFERR